MDSAIECESAKVVPHGYSPIRNFLAGGFGGSCGVVMTFPLDTLKVRLQAMSSGFAKVAGPVYKGTFDCLMATLRNEGFLALYRGMGTLLAFATPTSAMNFLIYSIGKRIQVKDLKDELTLGQTMKAGMFNGFCMSFIFAPVERIKCILQVQNSLGSMVPKFRGPLDCATQTYRRQGIAGIYRGLWGTVLREIPGGAVWFVTYESVLRAAVKSAGMSRDEAGPIAVLTAGAMAGMAYWSAILPADVLKTRYQTAPEGSYPRGVIDVLRRLLREESPRALYRGFTAVLLHAGPHNAAIFGGYEATMRLMKFLDQD